MFIKAHGIHRDADVMRRANSRNVWTLDKRCIPYTCYLPPQDGTYDLANIIQQETQYWIYCAVNMIGTESGGGGVCISHLLQFALDLAWTKSY